MVNIEPMPSWEVDRLETMARDATPIVIAAREDILGLIAAYRYEKKRADDYHIERNIAEAILGGAGEECARLRGEGKHDEAVALELKVAEEAYEFLANGALPGEWDEEEPKEGER